MTTDLQSAELDLTTYLLLEKIRRHWLLESWLQETDMSLNAVFSLFGAIIGVAALTVAVTHAETANIIKAFGSIFNSSLGTAMGK